MLFYLGEVPQDKKYKNEPTQLEIGDNNTIREFCTFNRGTAQDKGTTKIGDNNWIMAYVHIAHDCHVRNNTIMANNSSLAGHVDVYDHAILGGFTLVHQFCKVGEHVITAVGSVVFKDIPPYVTAAGYDAQPHGINAEGGGIAPSLIGVGAASVDFQVSTGRMPMADMSQQAMRKKPLYSPEEVAALAAYVASLAPGPAIPTAEQLNYERDGNVAEGGELFRTNCAMCHNAAAQGGALTGGKYAPSLMGVEPVHIYEAMITGPQAMPVFGNQAITPEEKLSIIKWIKSVESEGSYGGASLGKVGPVTEGLLGWVLGLGSLIGIAIWLATKAR